MNLGVFNRVNLKDSGGGMYSEWASLSGLVQRGSEESRSVLDKFSAGTGREVALCVVRQLATSLGITQAAEPSPLTSDKEVQWCTEVICFGLSLPLSEHDTVRDCVNVYCEWLSALYSSPKISVPRPIVEDTNFYARKIIGHFRNLFVPRKGEGTDTINRQAVLCHRVLRTLQQVARGATSLERETWESLLLFLIGINDALLAPPAVREDAGEQLCERVLGVLLEVWLVACERNFPSPPLWRTLRESCLRWRHRLALIEQWNRVCLALTAKLLQIMYGPMFPEFKINEEDAQLVPVTMSEEAVAQAWYRLLRTVGEPVDLCRPAVVSQTQAFLQYAIASPNVVDPCQHPCLQGLPQIFLKAIKGIAGQVDAFLGVSQACCWEECCASSAAPGAGSAGPAGTGGVGADKATGKDQAQSSPTPPTQRRLAKSFSVTPSVVTKGMPKASLIGLTSSRTSNAVANSGPPSTSSTTSATSLGQDTRAPLAPGRPKCNSILHLFGEWLFEAAFVGTDGWSQNLPQQAGASKRPSSVLVDGPSSLRETVSEIPASLGVDRYESGRAEAIGALCRIFCAKKTGEEILPVYYARFYQAMYHGLGVDESRQCGETLASILSNSADLFRLDLDGVEVLTPAVLTALEVVLPEKDLKLKSSSVSRIELRRASIDLLISMLALPLHYRDLKIRRLPSLSTVLDEDKSPLTFASLKPRLMNLLISALQVETDPQNTHMLLGGLLLGVQDSAVAEETDRVTRSDARGCATTNSLSSVGSDSASRTSVCSDRRSLGDTSDISTLQEESVAFDSAHALFVRATYLVCHRLISSWKADLNVSLAALEMLSGLARTRIRETDALECKRAVKWLCDYITYQCWRPPPAHSKDLHSSIVAAFGCLTTWLIAHPRLLQDKDCLTTVLEVVELGVSGTKSIGKPGEPIKMKDEKELKPASMRVRDAADALLTTILEQVGYFPSACGAQSLSSLLDEVSLLRHCNSWPGGRVGRAAAVERFRYFVAENATMLALLEEPLGNDQDPQPTVTLLIRGPFGRHAWTMQLRHLPRHRSSTRSTSANPGRPLPLAEATPTVEYRPRFFPDNIDRIARCRVDESIPSLEAVMNDNERVKNEHRSLFEFLERQISLESRTSAALGQEGAASRRRDKPRECAPPRTCHEFQTARLFLSHFGFLDPEVNGDHEKSSSCGLTALDQTVPGFRADLDDLDRTGSRTCDTVHVFYARAGQKCPNEIISNALRESNVSPHFLEFLSSLGWPVRVSSHAGWTGHASTSWRPTPSSRRNDNDEDDDEDDEDDDDHDHDHDDDDDDDDGAIYNGEKRVLYWADANSEIAFVVPTSRAVPSQSTGDAGAEDIGYSADVANGQNWFERSMSEQCPGSRTSYVVSQGIAQGPRAMSLDLDKESPSITSSGPSSVASVASVASTEPSRPRRTTRHHPPGATDTRIMVVWLESLEDRVTFPIADLLACTNTGIEGSRTPLPSDVHVIFLQALGNGSLRVRLQGPVSRINLATPLIDGMVVSRRVLGTMVRQTALNIGRRRRLDNDSYHPPHVRRRLKIQEMVQKYKRHLSQPELLALLFGSTRA